MIYVEDPDFTLHVGDVRDVLPTLPAGSIDCVVTSPPYWGLRDYGSDGQLGLEATPDKYVARLVAVFAEVRRVLVDEGTLWLNLGDSYNNRNMSRRSSHQGGLGFDSPDLRKSWVELKAEGRTRMSIQDGDLKEKDLVGIPWMVAFALRSDGWHLRSDIVWAKPNPMPESVTDRPTKAHEYVFLLTKSPRYYFDQDTVREPYRYDGRNVLIKTNGPGSHENHQNVNGKSRWPGLAAAAARRETMAGGAIESEPMDINHVGRNVRSVWEIPTQPYPDAHFAVFPEELARRCILAGCPEGGTVLDPFGGSGTTALVARQLSRRSVLIELNHDYARLAARRLQQLSLLA